MSDLEPVWTSCVISVQMNQVVEAEIYVGENIRSNIYSFYLNIKSKN